MAINGSNYFIFTIAFIQVSKNLTNFYVYFNMHYIKDTQRKEVSDTLKEQHVYINN